VETWQWLLTRDAAEIFDRCTRRERIRLVAAIDHIACFPLVAGAEHLVLGRKSPIYCATFGKWAVTWWVDFPAKEIHILDIERMAR
jgi:hypothetical protein